MGSFFRPLPLVTKVPFETYAGRSNWSKALMLFFSYVYENQVREVLPRQIDRREKSCRYRTNRGESSGTFLLRCLRMCVPLRVC